MRKFRLILAAALLVVSGNLFANDLDKTDPQKSLSTQIWERLKDNNLALGKAKELTATVLFTVNSEKEIVVISVETVDSNLESFVKSKLNYQKVELEDVILGKMYKLPVRVKV